MDNEKIEILNGLNARYEAFIDQFKLVEQQISELSLFNEELEAIRNKKAETIFAPIGKSVFAPVNILDEKLLVEIGAGYFVRKDLNETKEVIKEQKERLESFKVQISSEIDNIAKELQSLII